MTGIFLLAKFANELLTLLTNPKGDFLMPNDLFADLQEACKKVFEKHGIEWDMIKFPALISIAQIRNAQIRTEYFGHSEVHRTRELRSAIGKKYGIADENTIHKIIYEKEN